MPVPLAYPAKMLAPDKPLVKPEGAPITLAVNDKLSLQCVPIPAGRFLQGSPFYQWRYQDEFPHEVVLTKSYYMSEIPITQEMFEAVIGKNPSKSKGPQFPVEHATYADIKQFCKVLSEKNGKTVRVPTDAELEYAARVGTSNPCLPDKYKDQISLAGTREGQPAPVKTMKPNAWGLYDILCGGWHIASDFKADNVRVKQVDPKGPVRGADGTMHRSHGGWHYDHMRPSMHGAIGENGSIYEGGAPIFRVVVEAQ
jgi:formylglycine-generating enzyme required for sulfatase activity